MCQLTYCNLHDPYLNASMIYFLSIIGSDKHDDGTGMINSNNSIWKTEVAANKITNLGLILYSYIRDNKPVPFHIRSATLGIEVTKENAHPFDGQNYILMHNGTLIPNKGKIPRDKKKDSDSENFLGHLDELTNKANDDSFENIFNGTMENFSGKFAFIIRNKNTNSDYIIRGKTAELWISYLTTDKKKLGYVINTSKETMLSTFNLFKNTCALVDGNEYKLSEPLLLEQETIFIADKDSIKIVGKTKETTPILPVEISVIPFVKRQKQVIKGVEEIIKLSEKVYRYLDEHNLDLLDLQILFQAIAGISLLELTKEDVVMFTEFLIPKITASKKVKAKVKDILKEKIFPHELYKLHGLEYPWMLNDSNKVLEILKKYTKESVEN